MNDSAKLNAALEEAANDSEKELTINPSAATGKCVISSSGYSDCKNNITKESCDKQNIA